MPYRDFHFIYTPGIIYYLALFFRFFGPLVIVERIAAMLLSILGIIFLGLLIQKQTKNSIFTFLAMFLYALWGPAHINFLWPVMCILPLIFIYFFLFSKGYFFLSGMMIAVILLFKQNFGGALILAIILHFLLVRQSKQRILMISLGFLSTITLFGIHLLATHSFIPFISDMNIYTIQEILIRKSFSVPFPRDSGGKVLLYIFPGVISGFVALRTLSLIPITLFFVYLFGIFPTPDWPHLVPFISFTGILFAFLPRIYGKRFQFTSYLLILCVIGMGLYSITVRNYYRWESPMIKHTYCLSSGRMKYMCIDEKNYAIVTQTIPLIEKKTANNSFIFAFYNNPIYYFLTNKNNPTRYIDFNVLIGKKEEQKVVAKLKGKKITTIITRFPPSNNQSTIIVRYIERNFIPIKDIYEFTVWSNKKKN